MTTDNPSIALPMTPATWQHGEYLYTTVDVSCRWLDWHEWISYCDTSGRSPGHCGTTWNARRVYFYIPAAPAEPQEFQWLYGIFIQVVEVQATRRSLEFTPPPPGLSLPVLPDSIPPGFGSA